MLKKLLYAKGEQRSQIVQGRKRKEQKTGYKRGELMNRRRESPYVRISN